MNTIEKFPVRITNSLTGKKELFTPLTPGFVGLYVCGPTVYNFVHLGNCRTFLSFDIMVRYFRFLGYKVRYVRNITDVGHLESDADAGEDKIGKRARLEKLEPMEVVQQYTEDFHGVMRKFNILPPSIEPSASGHILEQIEAIKEILRKGMAYEVNGSVYFDVKKYHQSHHYGILSGRKIEELMESGRELDSQDEKRDKIDFALWKKASPEHIMRWPSPWSVGFPGWHLECSVMSAKYLGETFDKHGGGMDLKFPNHECEIAQGVGLHNAAPVRYWIHSNMLTVNGKKMSKSLGNSFLPEELFSGKHPLLSRAFSPMTVRFFMLQSHYSSTLDFSNEAITAAEKGFKKLPAALAYCQTIVPDAASQENEELGMQLTKLADDCYRNMSDDFNTAAALAVLFEMATHINNFKSGQTPIEKIAAPALAYFLNTFQGFMLDVLGLREEAGGHDNTLDRVLTILTEMRRKAKAERNFALSDKIREDLKKAGIQLKDRPDGSMECSKITD